MRGLRTILLAGCSLAAAPQLAWGQTAADEPVAVGEVIVTAQKRAERLQDVPIAVSSLSQGAMDAAGVKGAEDLRTQIPNATFARTFVNGANFAIRGIGAKLVTVTADTGVGVHVNNAPLTSSRITDAEFFDVERVEVLRGPQGTLYGRNATGGVFNVITAKPTQSFAASITGEVGNYDLRKAKGFINIPLGEMFSLRAAGVYITRDGYAKNTFTGRDADDRDLSSARVTLAFEPNKKLNAFLLLEHFQEKDRRMRGQKSFCTPDPGPASVGGVPTNPVTRGLLSQGCLPQSIYGSAALGGVNSLGTVYGTAGLATGMLSQNTNALVSQDRDLWHFESSVDPDYKALSDLVELNVAWNITPSLQFSSLTSYSKDDSHSLQQPESFVPIGTYANTVLSPGGVFNDPQLGPTRTSSSYVNVLRNSEQLSQELRLQSNFEGPVNFNVGGIYIKYDANLDFFYSTTAFTSLARLLNLGGAGIYVDPNLAPDYTGHNYLLARTPYRLRSKALFGEVYWKLADSLKFTGGLRYTDDDKKITDVANTLLTPGRGPVISGERTVRFKELTGRANLAWTPDLTFTDNTLVYASYSKGYKGGGFNPRAGGVGSVPPSYEPEFVNAFELGTKNTFAGGRAILNATAFYYDYKGYQVAKVVGVSVANENIDAEIKGLEVEGIVEPVKDLRLNATLGFLDTKIKSGSSLDELNLTQGDPTLTLVKNGNGLNCVANTAGVAGILAGINAGAIPPAALLGLCNGAFASRGVVVSAGKPADLKGNRMPDAPNWTVSLGAQYKWDLGADWEATLRGDYYRQSKSWSRIYNIDVDRLKGWENLNVSLTLENAAKDLQVLLYVRNVTNETAVVSSIPTNSIFGLFSNGFVNDPRTYGVSVTKSF